VLTPGDQNTQEWSQKIVDTISKMFLTDAATLYLVDETNRQLVISAASGYQRPLVEIKVASDN
jgi:signal transduction protein with GAF and PtsI domain